MLISESKCRDIFIFTLRGRIDAVTAIKLEDRFFTIKDNGEKNFIMDFAGVDYISSNGIRTLLVIEKKLAAIKGRLAFCSVIPNVFEVFKMTKLDSVFKFYDNQNSAVSALHDLNAII